MLVAFLSYFPSYFVREHLSVNLAHQVGEIGLSVAPKCHGTQVLHGCWGSELDTSCLHIASAFPTKPLPQPLVHIVSILFSTRDIERTDGKCPLFACAQEESSCGRPSPKLSPLVSSLSWTTFLTKDPLFQKQKMKQWALKMTIRAERTVHGMLTTFWPLWSFYSTAHFLNAFGTPLLCLSLCHTSKWSHSPFCSCCCDKISREKRLNGVMDYLTYSSES